MKTHLLFSLSILILAAACAPQPATAAGLADCPLTQPPAQAFSLPAGYDGEKTEPYPGMFWYGEEGLWTMLREGGVWDQLPQDERGFTQKIFWWADGYVWKLEPEPEFALSLERLDAEAPRISSTEATNAYTRETGSSILTGVIIPSAGCWQVTGAYKGTELSFVVWVEGD